MASGRLLPKSSSLKAEHATDMENYSVSSYPDSRDSSPRSREIDSWDELPPAAANTKVRFMCSYGGKIHPRPHDNQLAYVGGDTKILAVDRAVRLSDLLSKLSALTGGSEVCFKYQLPGEDLDALISVTNDEDLEHMMLEYDRLYRALAKPARLRLFLFRIAPAADPNPDGQWFVDALNSASLQSLETASPPSAAANPDFLFGFDKGPPPDPPQKLLDRTPPKEVPVGLEYSVPREDPAIFPAEIEEHRRLQISTQEQQARAYQGVYCTQKLLENLPPAPGPYWQDTARHVTTAGYPMPAAVGTVGADPPVYIIQGPGGGYLQAAIRPMTGQVGQAYYGMPPPPPQGVVPAGAYREHPVYNASVAVAPVQQPGRQGQGMDGGYGHVPYDGTGRQVYYTAPGSVLQPYQAAAAAAVDGRQAGVLSQEGKVMGKAAPPQASV